jgi:hypothetical protein
VLQIRKQEAAEEHSQNQALGLTRMLAQALTRRLVAELVLNRMQAVE